MRPYLSQAVKERSFTKVAKPAGDEAPFVSRPFGEPSPRQLRVKLAKGPVMQKIGVAPGFGPQHMENSGGGQQVDPGSFLRAPLKLAGGDSNLAPGSINDQYGLPSGGAQNVYDAWLQSVLASQAGQGVDLPPAEGEITGGGLPSTTATGGGGDPSGTSTMPSDADMINRLGFDPGNPYNDLTRGFGSGVPTQRGVGYAANIAGNALFPGLGMVTGPAASGITRWLQNLFGAHNVQNALSATQQPAGGDGSGSSDSSAAAAPATPTTPTSGVGIDPMGNPAAPGQWWSPDFGRWETDQFGSTPGNYNLAGPGGAPGEFGLGFTGHNASNYLPTAIGFGGPLGASGGNLGGYSRALGSGIWGGNNPYSAQRYGDLQGYLNYQGLPPGAQAQSNQGYSGTSYQDYLNQWNALRAAGAISGGGLGGPAFGGMGNVAGGGKPKFQTQQKGTSAVQYNRGVAKGFGPRHALNAQEGSEAVPSELPDVPEAAPDRGTRLMRELIRQARAGIGMSPEQVEEIRKNPLGAKALASYAQAGIMLMPEFGGEKVPMEGGAGVEPNVPPAEPPLAASKDFENLAQTRMRGAQNLEDIPHDESPYPWSQSVKVSWPDGAVHYDQIKGMDAGHALEMAKRNWPGAAIEPIDEIPEGMRRGKRIVGVAKGFGPTHAENAAEGQPLPNTDTVPAMLTPREAVLNRNAAELAGRGKIEKLNAEGNKLARKGVDLAAGGDKDVAGQSSRVLQPGSENRAIIQWIRENQGYDPDADMLKRATYIPDPDYAVQKGTSDMKPKPKNSKLNAKPSGSPYVQGFLKQLAGQQPPPPPQMPPQRQQVPLGFQGGGNVPPQGGVTPGLYGQGNPPPQPYSGGGGGLPGAGYSGQPAGGGTLGLPGAGPMFPGSPAWQRTHPDYQAPDTSGMPGAGPMFPGSPGWRRTHPNYGQGTGGSFYPPAQGLASGAADIASLGSQGGDAYGPPIQLSAPRLQRMAQQSGLSQTQLAGLMKAFQSMQGGGGGGAGAAGTGTLVTDTGLAYPTTGGYQGGISDIGYPPFAAPTAEYHADKGSNWTGPYDPNFMINRYARGTSSVPGFWPR